MKNRLFHKRFYAHIAILALLSAVTLLAGIAFAMPAQPQIPQNELSFQHTNEFP
ncbi:hypothetical protein J2128_001633 [Methanomicrobium sp. W14]|uniref:hypothetical protein n=1 Tax=Methanomicrobium sp. W14 TaxID=2817839 RepID=UPI001AE58895|nr:hypothetical protein [Methanomicrobium sp. W14]MBP2133679.1 hypothetical protein [Methanomicrobium sp. W14]